MKKIVAVIGYGDIEDNSSLQNLAIETGKYLIDSDYILATGGLGGVMEYASKGAHSSAAYTPNSVIGVLPHYSANMANPYIDIPLASGLGLIRNTVLISISTAVIAIGGGSGTLNEIAAAWQMNKLIIALQTQGWSGILGGKPLDGRRNDIIYSARTAAEAINLLNKKIAGYAENTFGGISTSRRYRLLQLFREMESLGFSPDELKKEWDDFFAR